MVTHGAPLTTFTFVNNSGNTLPAGSPVSFGQAFRYGDMMPGTYPLIRDAITHTPLAGQQWDEISTWRENGGNGSWRHAVWAAWLPKALAPGATYQVEFIAAAGTYSQQSHQALSALCSGPAAHDLKIHLTDVRNTDDTVRDSGDATFRLCDNVANVGRDATRHLRAGKVYDEYQVNGMFVYATSGHRDPLLYAQCNVDIFTKASDGASAGDVRWVCHLHNSWTNVAAGSTGNAGNPGPAGFANDPQAVSYRAEIDDGSSAVLDWSGLDATVTSASNPVVPSAGVGCGAAGVAYCLHLPSSAGANTWYYGQPTRATCSGGCIGGVNNGQLYYVWPAGTATSAPPNTQYVSLDLTPTGNEGGSFAILTGSQGTGTTTFSTRVQHPHWGAWQTLDASGQDNWSPFGTTTRVTRKVYPAFTAAEKRYWMQTGLVIPLDTSYDPSNIPALTTQWGKGLGTTYEPFGHLNVLAGDQGGARPDLGIIGEYATKAFLTEAEDDWDNTRLFTLGTTFHGLATLLNEATGRIPFLNNGPPTGPGGNGNGGSYAGLGAVQNQLYWGIAAFTTFPANMANANGRLNPAGYAIQANAFPIPNTQLDHMPAFDGLTYMIFGNRHWLDLMQWQGSRDFMQQKVGPSGVTGSGGYRDNVGVFPGDGNTYHYWGLTTNCCQTRGSNWLTRDVLYPATFGHDPNVAYPDGTLNSERAMFSDMITETSNYWPIFSKFRDGPGSTAWTTSIWPIANDTIGDSSIEVTVFQAAYSMLVTYDLLAFQHVPMGGIWGTGMQNFTEGVVGMQLPGMGTSPGQTTSFYAGSFGIQPAVQFADPPPNPSLGVLGNIGQWVNGVDATDFGYYSSPGMSILTGGQVQAVGAVGTITAGDTLKDTDPWYGFANIDQLQGGNRWYEIMGPIVNQFSPTFYVKCNSADHIAFPAQCPVAGQAFTGFTRGGVLQENVFESEFPKFRFQFDPGPGHGYEDFGYGKYIGNVINALHILGYNVSHATADYASRCPTDSCYVYAEPSFWWDPTIVVPGLPAPINAIP